MSPGGRNAMSILEVGRAFGRLNGNKESRFRSDLRAD